MIDLDVPAKKDNPKKPFSFTLDPDKVEKLKALADAERRSLSWMVEEAITRFLEEREEK